MRSGSLTALYMLKMRGLERERGVGNEMEKHREGEQTSAFLSGGPSVGPDIFHW